MAKDTNQENVEEFKEIFADPPIKELILAQKWTLWEQWEQEDQKRSAKDSYHSTMQKVANFHDLITFLQVWNSVPHKDPRKFFMDGGSNTYNQVMIKDGFKRVNGIYLFVTGVFPAWEDPLNAKGGEFSVRIVNPDIERLAKIWERLVFLVIGGSFQNTDKITGIRLVDKSKHKGAIYYKIEVWVTFSKGSDLESEMHKELRNKLFPEDDYIEFFPHS